MFIFLAFIGSRLGTGAISFRFNQLLHQIDGKAASWVFSSAFWLGLSEVNENNTFVKTKQKILGCLAIVCFH